MATCFVDEGKKGGRCWRRFGVTEDRVTVAHFLDHVLCHPRVALGAILSGGAGGCVQLTVGSHVCCSTCLSLLICLRPNFMDRTATQNQTSCISAYCQLTCC